MNTYYTYSEQETIDVGVRLGASVSVGDIVLLFGNIGSGKTVFSKGIALGLGVETTVTSPTFTLIQVYQGRIKMYHFDLYRLNSTYELFDIGYEELLYSEDGVAVVEWPERLHELCPESYIKVEIESINESSRKITIDRI